MFFQFNPLPCRVVEIALLKLGFAERKGKGTSHRQFIKIENGHLRKVTLDCHKGEVSAYVIKSIIRQAGITKEEFNRVIK